MSSNASKSLRAMKKKFGSSSTCALSETSLEPLLQTYTDHYGLTWVERKKDFINPPIYTYGRLGSIDTSWSANLDN